MAVMNGDEKPITAAPGVGKKIAQRLILELKDKMSKQAGVAATELPYFAAQAQSSTKNEAVTALMVLGYSTSEINAALGAFDPSGMTTEQIVKLALKNLMK